MKVSYELEKDDLDALNTVCYDVLDIKLDTEQLKAIFEILPKHIKGIGIQWGLSDTVFRDEAYEWLEKNRELALKAIQCQTK
jgi:two-component SAPR family response regulator